MPTTIKIFILERIYMITRSQQRGVTVRQLAMDSFLHTEIGGVSINALDRMLRHYHRQGLLKRYGKGHRYDPYRYVLSKKGFERIIYLKISLGDAAVVLPIELLLKRQSRRLKKGLATLTKKDPCQQGSLASVSLFQMKG